LALQLETATNLGQTFTATSPLLLQEQAHLGEQTSELDEFVLGALQSKILIALLLSKVGTLSSGAITRNASISASSWAKIKLTMMDQGLLICTHRRDMSEGRVIGSVEVKLTPKGILVAQNLLLIAGLLGKVPNECSNPLQTQALTA
jgi:hypothetical protein